MARAAVADKKKRNGGLARLGPRCEDVKDQLTAVDDFATDRFFEFADLAGAQLVIEDDYVCVAGSRSFH